jgi:hypothetical protein
MSLAASNLAALSPGVPPSASGSADGRGWFGSETHLFDILGTLGATTLVTTRALAARAPPRVFLGRARSWPAARCTARVGASASITVW